jgi:N-methylhydantoinase A/oxoprolinase/acetone carboxylase beta subunit
MRVGIDVGGTNTDAVVMSGTEVLGKAKSPTTPDVTAGIVAALRILIADGSLDSDSVTAVMIGTTHFTNAVVERKHLVPTAAIRLGLPATTSLPPFVDWPAGLRTTLGGHFYLCHGGHEFDGRLISELRPDELRQAAHDIAAKGITSVALSSVFSPVNAELELEASAIMLGEVDELDISLSHEIGRLGLLERENAAIVNACLRPLAMRTIDGFETALADVGIACPLHVSQNDGTLMNAEFARRYPVATFASGPTNSMRGAAFLSGVADGVVVDVGGTTADIGVLVNGFPREASAAVEIGGVRTNFRMPDVISLGLGGGSLVRGDADCPTIGPDSVGFELQTRALVFGGSELTATDIAVASGRAEIGDAAKVAHLSRPFVDASLDRMQHALATTIEQMKTSAEPGPVVIVGGGGVLVGNDLEGASVTMRPEHYEVANAIGAAIAQVGAETDQVYSLADMGRLAALDQARQITVNRAIEAGAHPTTIEVVDIEEVPLAYLPSNAVRIRVKAVGDLRPESSVQESSVQGVQP